MLPLCSGDACAPRSTSTPMCRFLANRREAALARKPCTVRSRRCSEVARALLQYGERALEISGCNMERQMGSGPII